MNPPFVVTANADFTEVQMTSQVNLLQHPHLRKDTHGGEMKVIAVLENMSWDEACAVKLAIGLKLKEVRDGY